MGFMGDAAAVRWAHVVIGTTPSAGVVLAGFLHGAATSLGRLACRQQASRTGRHVRAAGLNRFGVFA